MNRDQGLKRTGVITGALIAASLAGTVGIGIAAHAADQADSASNTTTSSSATDDSSSSGTNDNSNSSNSLPRLSTGNDNSGQATSGGS
jgi:hypothetical protein